MCWQFHLETDKIVHMSERKFDKTEIAGFCQHGNFPNLCKVCAAEAGRNGDIEAAVKDVRPYDSRENIKKHEVMNREPAYIVKNTEAGITVFGSIHTNDPESLTVARLKEELDLYADQVEPEKISLMIEGDHGGIDRDRVLQMLEGVNSIDESVERFGEKGAALWLVKEKIKSGVSVEITSPEKP